MWFPGEEIHLLFAWKFSTDIQIFTLKYDTFTLTNRNSQELFCISLELQANVWVNLVLTEDDHLLSHEILVVESGHEALVFSREFGRGVWDVECPVHGGNIVWCAVAQI